MTVLRVPAIRLLRRFCSTILEAREDFMERIQARLVGVELYFENLERAKKFYIETMGLDVSNEQVGHHVKFDSGAGFVCLERKGAESYPSKIKRFSSLR
jgi:catechol-2,3-dioxygenase